MKEFIEKLIGRLEELKASGNPYDSYWDEAMYRATELVNSTSNKTIDGVIEIVNQLAEEYKEINIPTIDAGELLGNSEQVKKTNADKIRAMSDEELADYLYKMTLASLTVVEVDSREIAIPKLLKWLQSEAE